VEDLSQLDSIEGGEEESANNVELTATNTEETNELKNYYEYHSEDWTKSLVDVYSSNGETLADYEVDAVTLREWVSADQFSILIDSRGGGGGDRGERKGQRVEDWEGMYSNCSFPV
jgi:hypothetical protein